MVIDQEIYRMLRTYGRFLSKNQREILNAVLQLSKKHTDACSEAVRIVPMHAILMAIVLERQRQLDKLLQAFDCLRAREQIDRE